MSGQGSTKPQSLFSERISMLRRSRGMTQKQVAELLSIDRSTYAYYESDKTRPDYGTLIHIADLFDVSLDFLLGRNTPTGMVAQLQNGTEPAADAASPLGLETDELTLLFIYQRLRPEQKTTIMQCALDQHYRKTLVEK